MYWNLAILSLVIVFVENGVTRLTPDYIHPCTVDNKTCLLQSTIDAVPFFSKGIPELGVPSMDPFDIDKVVIPLPGLQVSIFNGKVTGFRNAVVDSIESNYRKHKFVMEFHSNLTLKGTYQAKGRILTFPIDGEGDAKIKITNQKMKVSMTTHLVSDENGVQHFDVKNYKFTHDYGTRIHYNLTNLFKGNPELSNIVLAVINDSWRVVAEEVGKPVIEYAADLAVKTIGKFFLAVPFDELIEGPREGWYKISQFAINGS